MNSKAIHIIRPFDPTVKGGIAFRHEPVLRKPKINLFDPSPPPALKRPHHLLYSRGMTEKKQVILSEKALYLHNKQLSLSVMSQSDISDDIKYNNKDTSSTSSSSDTSYQDARTNRKVEFG